MCAYVGMHIKTYTHMHSCYPTPRGVSAEPEVTLQSSILPFNLSQCTQINKKIEQSQGQRENGTNADTLVNKLIIYTDVRKMKFV